MNETAGYTDQMYMAYEQQVKSRTKKAKGQCLECGAFRLDGQPVTTHRYQCSAGPDGSQVGAVWTYPADGNTNRLSQGINPQKRPSLSAAPTKRSQPGRR